MASLLPVFRGKFGCHSAAGCSVRAAPCSSVLPAHTRRSRSQPDVKTLIFFLIIFVCVPVDKPLPSNSRSSAAIATGCRAVGGRGAGGARWKMLCVGRGSPGPPPAPAAAAPGGVLVSLARGRGDGVGADPAAQLPNWPRGALRGRSAAGSGPRGTVQL